MNNQEKVVAIEWMNNLKNEWIKHNIAGVLELFAYVEEYYEGPFSAPVSSKNEVEALWEETKYQNIENLNIDLISFEQGTCAMHWHLKYVDVRDDNTYEMDGTYEVHFNNEGICTYFKQWWVMAY